MPSEPIELLPAERRALDTRWDPVMDGARLNRAVAELLTATAGALEGSPDARSRALDALQDVELELLRVEDPAEQQRDRSSKR